MNQTTPPIESRRSRTILWAVSFLIMAVALLYQRATGPTYPYKGSYEVNGDAVKYWLIRSEWTDSDARVVLPGPEKGVSSTLHWRRYPTDEEFTVVPMAWDAELEHKSGDPGGYFADLPKQLAAGKLEYFVEVKIDLEGDVQEFKIHPEAGQAGEGNILIRYKDPVPEYILFPHIFMMFLSMWFGMRAAFGSVFSPVTPRRLAWLTLLFLTIGGMMLGPLVQKYAFGHYWTGYPNGKDLTDNKMLIMWLSWIFACAVIGTKAKPKEGLSRVAIVVAAIVMTVVYCIPHSMRGSELNYAQVDEGLDPRAAVGTGEE